MAERKGGRKKGSGKVYRGSPDVSEERWALFLAEFAKTGNVTHSAKVAKISRETVYLRKRTDPEFAQRFADALVLGDEALKDEGRRRAFAGSDYLLLKFMAAKFPEFRERQSVEHTGSLKVERAYELSDEELAAIAAGGRGRAAATEEGED